MYQKLSKYAIALRTFHGIITLYLTLCLAYLYIVAFTGNVNNALFVISFFSLAFEAIAIFAFNKGDCPLIHIQRKIGDDKPFFELLFPPRLAKRAIPVFALLTIVAILIILVRLVHN